MIDDLPEFTFDEPAIEPFETIDAADILSQPYVEPAFLAKHIIPRRAVGLVTGDSGAGKTALMVHACVAIAVGLPVAGRFDVEPDARPVLYINGEMAGPDVHRYLASAAAGIGQPIPHGRLHFEGRDGFASFQLSDESKKSLEATCEVVQPCLVIFDTSRALFASMDENSAAEVGMTFSWLRALANRFDCSVIVAHHRRKISATSNSDRERVAGSTALIGAPDFHVVLRASGGKRLTSIKLDKTRTPFEGVASGTEWAVEARLEPVAGYAPRSIFVAGDCVTEAAAIDKLDDAKAEILALIDAEGPLTIEAMGAAKGTRKRAYEALRSIGVIVECGKDSRKTLYGLPDAQLPDELNAVKADRTRDRTRAKPNTHKGLNAVKADRTRDRTGRNDVEDGPPRSEAGTDSTTASERVRSRSYPIGDRTRDRVREKRSESARPRSINDPHGHVAFTRGRRARIVRTAAIAWAPITGRPREFRPAPFAS
jgi:KaiC/GvpD/RAD55 family RecA-like ATPase